MPRSMLGLIPAPLHRRLYRIAHVLRARWRQLRKPTTHGCRILALEGEGRVLLVRHSYGSGKWMPPGGGIRRNEDPVAAAVRELREETGCGLSQASLVVVIEETLHGTRNVVHVVAGRTSDAPIPDDREVIAAGFFALAALPDDMSAHFREGLPAWLAGMG